MNGKEVVAGIDIGGTTTKLGIVDEEGNILVKERVITDAQKKYEDFFQFLCQRIKYLNDTIYDDHHTCISGMGIGAPNGNCYTGNIDNAANLAWNGKIPVVSLFEKMLNLPSFLSNDANSAALGEMKFGMATGMKNFAVITLGTGLGCGLVVNGQLVIGHNGHAAEIGHSNVYHNGRSCSCGLRGCLETYVSGAGVIRTVKHFLQTSDEPSMLRKKVETNNIDSIDVTNAALAGDKIALKTYDYTGKILGYKLADLVSCIDPEAIIFIGGLAKAGALLINPAKRYMEENLLHIYKGKISLAISNLNNDDVGILGAAAVAWKGLRQKIDT